MSVVLRREGDTASLLLENPERGNALSPAMMVELADRIGELGGQVRVLRIRGAGERAFCGGFDLTSLGELLSSGEPRLEELTALVEALEAFPQPVVAELNGDAIGAGALVAALCDLRIAVEGVRFAIPATRLGVLYPLAGMSRLVALLGVSRASSLLLTARVLGTAEGLGAGFYEAVVTRSDFDSAADSLAEALASRAPLAVAGTRAVLRGLGAQSSSEDLERLHREHGIACLRSGDLLEGVLALKEKRSPRFRGA